jgi:nucleoid-associated protein YgaU
MDLSAAPAGGSGTRFEFSKPPNTPAVTPATATERQPTTSYDVDIYEAKAGDSWEAISREFYSDTKYAAALRAYNQNKALQVKTSVDVPPIHVLRRTSPQPSAGTPASRPADPWGPAAVTPAAGTSGGGNSYRVPRGGTSLPAVAKAFLKNEQRWRELYDLNQHIADANYVPEGTEIKLPSDARVP